MGLSVGLHRIERAVEPLDTTLTIREGQTVALQEGLLASNLTKGIYFVKTVGNTSQCSKKIMVE